MKRIAIIGAGLSGLSAAHLLKEHATTTRDQSRSLFLDQDHKLTACGDWCLGGRVEGAFTSAYNLVLKMKERVL